MASDIGVSDGMQDISLAARGHIEYEGKGSLEGTIIVNVFITCFQLIRLRSFKTVGDAVKIFYTPPKDFFREGAQIICAGGYDGWSSENFDIPPLRLPVLRDGESLYVTITIPNFARALDLFFTDGIKYDLNNGALYHIPVTKIQVPP
jgi:hypothetical protein